MPDVRTTLPWVVETKSCCVDIFAVVDGEPHLKIYTAKNNAFNLEFANHITELHNAWVEAQENVTTE